MRGSYPIAATHENWLHDSLVQMIQVIHTALDSNSPIPRWPQLIPTSLTDQQFTAIEACTGIRDRIKRYEVIVAGRTPQERQEILQVLGEQNSIVAILDKTGTISSLAMSYPDVDSAARALFVFAYEKLTDLGIRDRQYQLIFNALATKVCIFCGFERIMSPEETRQDQDHYLAKSIYPFAAANMRNLAPMCRCCNRDYKHDLDVVRGQDGQRFRAFDPYGSPLTNIDLSGSIPFAGIQSRPEWRVEFFPASEEVENWNRVFSIKLRYSRDVLDHGFNRWIESFMTRCKRMKYPDTLDDAGLLAILHEHYQSTLDEQPTGVDFLKPNMFKMFIHHFESGNERVIRFIRDIVVGASVQA